MNKKKLSCIGEKTSEIIAFIKEHRLAEYTIGILACVYFFVTYGSKLLKLYENSVIKPYGRKFESNIWLLLLLMVIVIVVSHDIYVNYKNRYQCNPILSIILLFAGSILLYCRLSGEYYYYKITGEFSYCDIIILICFAYPILAVINLSRYHIDKRRRTQKDNNSQWYLFNDQPINDEKEDKLLLKNEAKKIVQAIQLLDRDATWSIGITAPWGGGKTSFINLVLYYIKKDDFEIIKFFPRNSKSSKTIQEDFFSLLSSQLSKYDSRLGRTLKNYMTSLQLIDNSGIFEKATTFYKIWDTESLKESIRKTFKSLKKKVIVVIDDFDRLSRDEILEVLKLIDSNADFTNLVFLTAYDKEQVNKICGNPLNTVDAYYTDKFFNLEYPIPFRPSTFFSDYLIDNICRILYEEKDRREIKKAIQENILIFEKYIPTLRDAKRYINQILLDYNEVRGEVVVRDYLLIELIKYRDPNLYKRIFRKELFSQKDIIHIRQDIMEHNTKMFDVLSKLFDYESSTPITDIEDEKNSNHYKHICDPNNFINYFVNYITCDLRIKDIENLFSTEWGETKELIDRWVVEESKKNALFEYLIFQKDVFFKDARLFPKYAKILAYFSIRCTDFNLYNLFMDVIKESNLKMLNEEEKGSCRTQLLEILQESTSPYSLVRNIHVNYKRGYMTEEDYIIKDIDIWPFIKNKFIQASNKDNYNDDELKSFWRDCIDYNGEIMSIDNACLEAYRRRIEKFPAYFINNFVRLGMRSTSPYYNTISCDDSWNKIFKDNNQFEMFLSKCKEDKVGKVSLVMRFWDLYKANDYHPIEFINEGDVQKKIDNGLVYEYNQYEKIKGIEEKLKSIPDSFENVQQRERDIYLVNLEKMRDILEKIHINLRLKWKVLKSVKLKIGQIKLK